MLGRFTEVRISTIGAHAALIAEATTGAAACFSSLEADYPVEERLTLEKCRPALR